MISLQKFKILTPLQKLPKYVRDLDELIVAPGFDKFLKAQWITQSGHTAHKANVPFISADLFFVYICCQMITWG